TCREDVGRLEGCRSSVNLSMNFTHQFEAIQSRFWIRFHFVNSLKLFSFFIKTKYREIVSI
ncbi:Uncharacterized protein APZ42_008152, partial [Daphnia magna]